jgi:hypothetical protein
MPHDSTNTSKTHTQNNYKLLNQLSVCRTIIASRAIYVKSTTYITSSRTVGKRAANIVDFTYIDVIIYM